MQMRYQQTCTLWGNLQEGRNVAPTPWMPGNEWLFVWMWESESL